MKLKYFFYAFAVLCATVLVSCSDDDEATLFDELRVSSSYVALDVQGGSATIEIEAAEAWSIDESKIPAWLIVSPTSGNAGKTTITFSAPMAENGRSGEIKINSGKRTQNINIIQGLPMVTDATCAEVIAGPDSKTYRVTGTVTEIYNTEYGNWYLVDETGRIQIYGTLDAKGKAKNFLSLGIEEGDIVTVEGPKKTYNGATELENVTVVKHTKSLIKVTTVDPEDCTFPQEGGNVAITLANKGNGISVDIPNESKDWLSMTSIGGTPAEPYVVFKAQPNTMGDRSTTVTFKTTSNDGTVYTATATLNQKGAIIDCTIAEFNAAPKGDTQYRITGVISSIADAAKGRFYIKDYSGETYAFNLNGFTDSKAKVGDIVTLVGKKDIYNNTTNELVQGKVEDLIPVTEVTIAEFLNKPDSKDTYYMVTGTISSLKDNKGNDNVYGNLYMTDGSNDLYVYGCYPGYGATGDLRKGFIASAGIQVGDKLTMIGYKDTYNGLVELCGGIYFSHLSAN